MSAIAGRITGALLGTRAVLTATVALLCVPVAVDLAVSPRNRPFGYVAADTFYYLTVARNMARAGSVSFDGEHASNGFHPLWQLVTGGLYAVATALNVERHVVLVTVVASLACVAGAVVLLGLALRDAHGRLSPAFLLLPVGAYALACVPLWWRCRSVWSLLGALEGPAPLYGTLYSFVNGMESGPVLLFYGALAWLFVRARARPSGGATSALGVAAALMALSRLDHALLAAPIVLGFAAASWLEAGGRGRAFIALGSFGAPLGAYMLVNAAVFGHPVPVSGQAKSLFPLFTSDHVRYLRELFDSGSCESHQVFFRVAQTLVPIAGALAVLPLLLKLRLAPSGFVVHLRRSSGEFERFLALTAVGVLLLGTHHLLFTPFWDQGHWYFPVSILFLSLAVVSVLSRASWRVPGGPAALASAGFVAISVAVFAAFFRQPQYHAKWARFYWEQAPRIREHYAGTPPKLLECDDGIVNFALDTRAMSHAYSLDPEGYRARAEGRLFELAVARGFDRVTSLVYRNGSDLARSADNAFGWAQGLLPDQSLEGFEAKLDYLAPDHEFAIVRLQRSAGGKTP